MHMDEAYGNVSFRNCSDRKKMMKMKKMMMKKNEHPKRAIAGSNYCVNDTTNSIDRKTLLRNRKHVIIIYSIWSCISKILDDSHQHDQASEQNHAK